jgi:hypothetical protein
MNAGEFDGTSNWGLSFTIWNEVIRDKNNFSLEVKKSDEFGNIIYLHDKTIYNLDNEISFSDWIKRDIKGIKTFDAPQLTNPINVFPNHYYGNIANNSLGFYFNGGNNVNYNAENVSMFTSCYKMGHGISILPVNFMDSVSNFAARKLFIKSNWINDKDEYISPKSQTLETQEYKQWNIDSLVLSLFHIHSFQSSLRSISYENKKWDIKNEFFWMSKDEMMELSENKYFDDIYRDARSSDERYVYTLLHKEGLYEKLSPDAKGVLDMATELVKKTFDMREILHTEHPEYHLNTWDAGWYQIKLILKAFYPEDLKDFTKKYKEFEDRMRPLVYELGFLRK